MNLMLLWAVIFIQILSRLQNEYSATLCALIFQTEGDRIPHSIIGCFLSSQNFQFDGVSVILCKVKAQSGRATVPFSPQDYKVAPLMQLNTKPTLQLIRFTCRTETLVFPGQKVTFMINRTVASCEAIKFKSNYQRKNYVTLCSTTEKWRVSVVKYNSPQLVGWCSFELKL